MRHVIVTGGSSGIGAAIARRCLQRGDRVTIVGRDRIRLDDAARQLGQDRHASRLRTAQADVCDAAALDHALSAASAAFGPCDLLVASAGIVVPGRFADQARDAFEAQVATNLLGAANAVRAVYPAMRIRRSGRILLIGSGAGLIGIFGYAGYCASKFGLHGFAEALRSEARRDGIAVSICHPPDTATPQLEAERRLRPPEAELVIGKARVWSADAVAAAALAGAERGRFAIYPGPALKLLALFGSLANPVLRRMFDGRMDRMTPPRGP